MIDTGAPLSISNKLYQELKPEIINIIETTNQSGKKYEIKYISLPVL
jgi:hypothetical protein